MCTLIEINGNESRVCT